MPCWNVSYLRKITPDHFKMFGLFKFLLCRKINFPNSLQKVVCRLFLKNNNLGKKIICVLGKLQRVHTAQSFCSHLLRWKQKAQRISIFLSMVPSQESKKKSGTPSPDVPDEQFTAPTPPIFPKLTKSFCIAYFFMSE